MRRMRSKWFVKVLVCAIVFAFASSGFCAELQSSRIMPSGKVVLYKGDQKAGEFTSEAPFPEGYELQCQGRCAAKMNDVFLVAEDKTRFSVSNNPAGQDIQLKEGTVYFALSKLSGALVFSAPNVSFSAEELVVNASTSGVLKGYVKVTAEAAEIGVTEGGSMMISSPEGKKMIGSGEKIVVAQNDKGAAAAGTTTAAAESGTSILPMLGVVGGILAAQGALILATDTDDDHEASPYSPN